MGLDMYLYRENYYGNDIDSEKRASVDGFNDCDSFIVKECAIYWRKVNAIHYWFVTNVQGGIDECQCSRVSENDLKSLLDTVKQVLKDRNKAEELLPATRGFFFGSTSYDDNYFDDLRRTEIELEQLLNSPDFNKFCYNYRSSW